MSAADDRALCERLAQGDRSALKALYDAHAGPVFSLALRLLRSRSEAEEIVQETFLEAWQRIDRYQPERAAVGAWLFNIAKSRAIDRLRRHQAQRRATDQLLEGEPGQSPDVMLDAMRAKHTLTLAVAQLPMSTRELLDLAWREGLSQTQIAERTGLPLGTVKTRTRQALLKLNKTLREGDG